MFKKLLQKSKKTAIETKARNKQILAVAGASIALLAVIALFTEKDKVQAVYHKKHDQITSVFTDQSNRNVGLDNLSGQVKKLSRENDALRREIQNFRTELERFSQKDVTASVNKEVQKLRTELNRVKSERQHDQVGDKHQESLYRDEPSNPFYSSNQRRDEELASRQAKNPNVPVKKERLKISVISEPEEIVKQKQEAAPKRKEYIPSGSILTGTILTGGDFPTGDLSRENPQPSLIRLQKNAILPNRYRSDVRECFLLVSGHGDLSSERAKLRGERLSCVRTNGEMIEQSIAGYLVGEDGKEGVKGRLVSKQGQLIARSLVSGFASGVAKAFDQNAVPVVQTQGIGNTPLFQQSFSNQALQGGVSKGASTALDKIAAFYMKLAESMVPVVEINAGRQVDFILTKGMSFEVEGGVLESVVQSVTANNN